MTKPLSLSEETFKSNFHAAVARGELVCDICGLPKLIHPHRVEPGRWGGRYEEFNVVPLCPTHHFAVHFLIDWYMCDKACANPADAMLLARLKTDPPLWRFWRHVQWPVCMVRVTGKPFFFQWRCQRCGTELDETNESNDRKRCRDCEAQRAEASA